MEKFRNLSNNIFFKIFLAFLGLTFITWGVGDFILTDKGSWVAKVDGKRISYKDFLQNLRNQKEVIYRSNPKESVLKYLDSEQFKYSILNQMITKSLINSLQAYFKIYINEELVLQQISENTNFTDQQGKFNRTAFINFLNHNHLKEKDYIDDIKSKIAGTIVIEPLVSLESSNKLLAENFYKYAKEKRIADVITLSLKNVGNVKNPNNFELTEYFEKNKVDFALPQMRKVSYFEFQNKDIIGSVKVSKEEVSNYYQDNIEQYKMDKSRDFYHILFESQDKAKQFLEALNKQSPNSEVLDPDIFVKLAKELEDKDKNSIYLPKITKKALFREISDAAFNLKQNQHSQILESPIGFHIFYLLSTNPESTIPLEKVQDKIKEQLLAKKQDEILTKKLSNIEDELLVSNSLTETAEKFGLNVNKNLDKFTEQGLDSRGNPVSDFKDLDHFVANSFSLNEGETSKLFYSKSSEKYYALTVDKISKERQRSLDEVRVLATDRWIQNKKQERLQELANNIYEKIKNNPEQLKTIVNKNNLIFEKNLEFPRFYQPGFDNSRITAYSSEFLEDIFSLKTDQVSSPHPQSGDKFIIGIVKRIIVPKINEEEIKQLQENLIADFKNDIITEYNKYIQNKFLVEVNEALIQSDN